MLRLLVFTCLSIGLVISCDNCTDDSVTIEELYTDGHSRSTLAWLVTPALFFVGVIYVIYKCCRDGLCNCRRLRQRAAEQHQQEHGYIPLSEVAVYASSVPGGSDTQGHRQLVLVHNQTFCVTFTNPPHQQNPGQTHPPSYEESQLNSSDQPDTVHVVPNPPSYISSNPPRYSVAVGEPSPRPSISEEASGAGPASANTTDVIVISERPRQLRFISQRRRHCSAQDARTKHDRRRHFSAQDRKKPVLFDSGEAESELDETIRQRCFSFNALKDAFSRRSQQSVPECESLLADQGGIGGTDSVFSSREAVSSPGPAISPINMSSFLHNSSSSAMANSRTNRRPPQQVSFEDRILEESNESLDASSNQATGQGNGAVHLRQRHFSAPDRANTRKHKSRHASGNS